MQSKVSPYAATPDPTFGQNRSAPGGQKGQSAGAGSLGQADEADLRLIIEEDHAGGYVYKIVDRKTGEIVQQLPRDEVLRMREHLDYQAGGVIRTKA
jgi:flagellar protein FlaG